jgi:hypothetical protein
MTNKPIAAFIALAVVAVGIICGAALSMAGMANAATSTGPGHSYSPGTKAHPAPTAQPGWHNHHGVHHIENLDLGYTR